MLSAFQESWECTLTACLESTCNLMCQLCDILARNTRLFMHINEMQFKCCKEKMRSFNVIFMGCTGEVLRLRQLRND